MLSVAQPVWEVRLCSVTWRAAESCKAGILAASVEPPATLPLYSQSLRHGFGCLPRHHHVQTNGGGWAHATHESYLLPHKMHCLSTNELRVRTGCNMAKKICEKVFGCCVPCHPYYPNQSVFLAWSSISAALDSCHSLFSEAGYTASRWQEHTQEHALQMSVHRIQLTLTWVQGITCTSPLCRRPLWEFCGHRVLCFSVGSGSDITCVINVIW